MDRHTPPRHSCYTCEHFGQRRGIWVWCERPDNQHLVSMPSTGCAFWMRAIGGDDEGEPPEYDHAKATEEIRALSAAKP